MFRFIFLIPSPRPPPSPVQEPELSHFHQGAVEPPSCVLPIGRRRSFLETLLGLMIKGDYDQDSNWQVAEYVLDKLNSEGCNLGMRFYNALLEALWWLNQRERAARVLSEATRRGLFPELFHKNKLLWSVDVHRMWEGGASTAIAVWLNDMKKAFISGEDLPQLAAVSVVRGRMETSPASKVYPVAKASYSLLQDLASSYFSYPAWNRGRIVCQRTQLNRILSNTDSDSDAEIVSLSNSPSSFSGARTFTSRSNSYPKAKERKRKELVTSSV